MATKKKKTNPGVDTIRQRKQDTKRAIDGPTKKKPTKKVSGKSQTNSRIKKDADKLKGMTKKQIEKLRAELKAKKAKKKGKKK